MNLPRAYLLLPVLAMVLLHLVPDARGFLSDDFTHFHWLHAAATKGELATWVASTYISPLPSGNFAYRPVVFTSYAIDYLVFGANATGWHLINVLIHALNACLAGLLVFRAASFSEESRPDVASMLAIAFAAWIPFAGESTLWPVGRFDLLACFFSLIFLLQIVRVTRAAEPQVWQSLGMGVVLLLALLSKESAMPMVAVGVAFSIAIRLQLGDSPPKALLRTFRVHGAVVLMVLGYFIWRQSLFGSAWKVYPDSRFPNSFGEAIERIATLANAPRAIYGDATPWVAAVAGIGFLTLLAIWLRRKGRKPVDWVLPFLLIAFAGGYLLAPATSFPVIGSSGEGTRNLYIGLVLGACGMGWLASLNTKTMLAAIPCLAISLAGHALSVRAWQLASENMHDAQAGIPLFMAAVPNEKFVLLMLPDHLAAIPFLRNAQGGIVVPPTQIADFTSRGVGMTPLQFDEWAQHFRSGTVDKLKGHAFEMSDFLGVACWNPVEKRFGLLPRPFSKDVATWQSTVLADAEARGCIQ